MPVPDAMRQYREYLEQVERQKREAAFLPSCRRRIANLRKRLNNRTTAHASAPAQNRLGPPKPGSPTLLTIPQELRDMIFAHVFDTTDPTGTMDLRIIFYTNPQSKEQSIHAGTFPRDSAPPSKDALLVCRQLYAEQKQSQAAAYRRWWTAQRFAVTFENPFMLAQLRPVARPDLQRIRWFAYAPIIGVGPSRILILIPFRFEAATPDVSSWSATIERSQVCTPQPGEVLPWHLTEGCARREAFLKGLEGIVDDIRVRSGGVAAVDPTAGRGLDAQEVYALASAVEEVMGDSG